MIYFSEKDLFIAVIGDIRDSRRIESRKLVQDKLKKVLQGINKKYENEIVSKFVITLGDEFQGVLGDSKKILNIIEEIKMELSPVELRFGVGIGKITTDIDTEMALGADGPGYYNARNAIDKLKENEKKNKTVLSDLRIEIEINDARVNLINTIFELLKTIESNWTERQRQIIWDMRKHQDGQTKVANRLGIEQPAVHKALSKGKYYVYVKAMETVIDTLEEMNL